MLPIGTHDWQKFIKPDELIKICEKFSNSKNIDGMSFNPIVDKWKISKDKSVNYITKFEKINFLYHQSKEVFLFLFLHFLIL